LQDVTTGCEGVKDELKIEEHEILPIVRVYTVDFQ
jgi:hypothetical protein